ncbi:NADH-ubiquinone/plastoquinone oxidoreductase [Enterococcus sp. PF-2]|nr:NADH-ubiquinone/plastoquinone oxidoreductase [Enterococcus sp. CR-Ec1]MBO1121650.1 NADH-ubiquinone/plastoquinone oxidoreductase [Enterococcus casseliflavus]TPE02246.1 NADH-ubiquinone/plastoquinone oxidoreductase [Enterococcus sp. PF-3]TPE25405.1 NADH-ubiquinone/plastoquinone oxidoreductase [Enterococcus sp. PF-2]
MATRLLKVFSKKRKAAITRAPKQCSFRAILFAQWLSFLC